MKVALGCNNFPPEFQGGTERVALALAHALRAAGDDVIVITGSELPHQGEDVVREDALGMPVFRIKRLPHEVYGLEEMVRPRVRQVIEKVLRSERVEVLHLHQWANLCIDVLRAARACGVASIVTLHDMWTTCPRFFRRPPDGVTCPQGGDRDACGPCVHLAMSQVPVWALRLGIADRDRAIASELHTAYAVCTPSHWTAAAIARHLPWSGAIEVVPHGLLEVPRGAPEASEPRTPFRVGTFGNLVEEKGVGLLVEAMAGLDAELHLFGPFLVPEFAAKARRDAERLGVHMHCHGAYDAIERHPARELDLAVFPSLCEESYGLVVEEALSRGVPVVVSDAGALAERIGGAGLVCAKGDVTALQAALREVIGDPERHRRLRAAIPAEFATIADASAGYRALYRAAVEAMK